MIALQIDQLKYSLFMPSNQIGEIPFTLKVIDSDLPLELIELEEWMDANDGITLCVRSKLGAPKRGGYFFHFKKSSNNFEIFDFEKNSIDKVDLDFLIRFINHVSGRSFDASMQSYCQTIVNLRQD